MTSPSGCCAAAIQPNALAIVNDELLDGMAADRTSLQAIAKHNRIEIPGMGKWACAGSYATVTADGEISVGDEVVGERLRRSRVRVERLLPLGSRPREGMVLRGPALVLRPHDAAGAVQADDARMVELAQDGDFAEKAVDSRGAGGRLRRDDLDRTSRDPARAFQPVHLARADADTLAADAFDVEVCRQESRAMRDHLLSPRAVDVADDVGNDQDGAADIEVGLVEGEAHRDAGQDTSQVVDHLAGGIADEDLPAHEMSKLRKLRDASAWTV